MITEAEKQRIINNLSTFRAITEITAVPTLALLTLWYLKGLKISSNHPDGPLQIDSSEWTEERIIERLNRFSRLSDRDVRKLAGKPVKSFVLNVLLAAVELLDGADIGLYPDMHKEALTAVLRDSQGAFDKAIIDELEQVLLEGNSYVFHQKKR